MREGGGHCGQRADYERLGLVKVTHQPGSPPVNEVPGVSITTQALRRVTDCLLTRTTPPTWENR
jgi:hypothetical protein